MKVTLNFTPFRRMIRPLSLYSETTRSKGPDGKVTWKIGRNIRIFGYRRPDHQVRLTVITLNPERISGLCNNHPEFSIKAPTTRGMGTAAGGKK